MPITKIGINLTALGDLSVPVFEFKNTSAELVEDIPARANEVTGGFFGLIVLVGLFIWIWWKLQQSDVAGGDFNYDQFRSIGIASAVCAIMGLFAVNFGLFSNFFHVVIFIVIAFIMAGVVWKTSRD